MVHGTEARCIGCPDNNERIAQALAVICGTLLGLLGLYLLLKKLPWKKYAATRAVQHVANRAANMARRYKLLPKLKLFIAFFQVSELKSACPDPSSHEIARRAALFGDPKPSPLSGGLRGARDLRRGAARGATLVTPPPLIPELHP